MQLTLFDGVAFAAFIAAVIAISLYASRKEESSQDYFLAGRSLSWWLIGFSLIASNISTEHFVGMAGKGFGETGMAIASYEWIAAISLVVVALFLLPLFLRLGIYTMPEFLEYRYGPAPRTVMAVYLTVAYVAVALATVLYSGALGLITIFDIPSALQQRFDMQPDQARFWALILSIWLIGVLAGAYTIYGGLKAVVWSDFLQGATLLIGGVMVTVIGLSKVGGFSFFMDQNADKLHMVLPRSHPDIPWTALLLGIWIPNFFYWGCNQFITQRTLAARSLAQGQKGIVCAAFLKLLMPFIIVIPGIMAFQLYGDQIANKDQAYPVLIQHILPAGLRGIFLAALVGAVMSSLDSMLNSASTIFTMDLYKRYLRPQADERRLLKVGRVTTAVLVVAGCLMAPFPEKFGGVFEYIQKMWGFISPGILAVFVFGLIIRRAPSAAAVAALIAGVPVYGLLLWFLPGIAFLNHMAITFAALIIIMGVITALRPLPAAVTFKTISPIDLTPSRSARWLSAVVIALTVALYILFW